MIKQREGTKDSKRRQRSRDVPAPFPESQTRIQLLAGGPPRMVKQPTGSGGEPSSPNCVASAGYRLTSLFFPGEHCRKKAVHPILCNTAQTKAVLHCRMWLFNDTVPLGTLLFPFHWTARDLYQNIGKIMPALTGPLMQPKHVSIKQSFQLCQIICFSASASGDLHTAKSTGKTR